MADVLGLRNFRADVGGAELDAGSMFATYLTSHAPGGHGHAGFSQRGCSSGGRDDEADAGRAHFALGTLQFAVEVLFQAGYILLVWRIAAEEFLLQPDCAKGQADHLANAALIGEGDLATSAAKVDQDATALGAWFVRDDAEMDEAALFQTGNDFDLPAGGRFDPCGESGAVAGVAHGGGGNDTDLIDHVKLDGFLEALERQR